MKISQLTIVGAGLIGGSLALAAKKAGAASRIVALDRKAPSGSVEEAVFDHWAKISDESAVKKQLRSSELTVLCVPVRTIVEMLPSVLEMSEGWVTDCGSTKAKIVQAVADHPGRSRFIAGHPMAGRPRGGLKNAVEDLFEKRTWILCPEGSDGEGIRALSSLITQVGAEKVELTVEEHDRSVALTSHIPQLLASVLSVQAAESNAMMAAGPGFASATRVAGGAEAMWGDIFRTNGTAIGHSLFDISEKLRAISSDLEEGNVESALALLEAARKLKK